MMCAVGASTYDGDDARQTLDVPTESSLVKSKFIQPRDDCNNKEICKVMAAPSNPSVRISSHSRPSKTPNEEGVPTQRNAPNCRLTAEQLQHELTTITRPSLLITRHLVMILYCVLSVASLIGERANEK